MTKNNLFACLQGQTLFEHDPHGASLLCKHCSVSRSAPGRLGCGRRRHPPHALPAVILKGLFELFSAVTESRDVVGALNMKLAIRRRPRQLIPTAIAGLTYLAHQPPLAPLEKPDHLSNQHIGPECVGLQHPPVSVEYMALNGQG
jgi:hypothetical protein